jgi:hypothetical protein
MKKLPKDFASWIQLHDYLKARGFTNQSVLMSGRLIDGSVNTYKVTWRTIERNCWKELQQYRMQNERSIITQHLLDRHNDIIHKEYVDEAIRLLKHLKINNNN